MTAAKGDNMSGHRSDRDDPAHDVTKSHDDWGTGDEPLNLAEQAAIEVGTFLDNMFGGGEEGDGWRNEQQVTSSRDRQASPPERSSRP